MELKGTARWYGFGSLTMAVLVLLVYAGFGPPQGGKKSELRWYKLTEGLEAAEKADKKVLVDIYTEWCGWCKKMDEEVYTDAGVMEYLDERYILVKMDAESPDQVEYAGEKMSEEQLSSAFGVRGFPTTIFLLPNGEPITLLPGYIQAEQFLGILTYIGEDHYENMKYEEFLAGQQSK